MVWFNGLHSLFTITSANWVKALQESADKSAIFYNLRYLKSQFVQIYILQMTMIKTLSSLWGYEVFVKYRESRCFSFQCPPTVIEHPRNTKRMWEGQEDQSGVWHGSILQVAGSPRSGPRAYPDLPVSRAMDAPQSTTSYSRLYIVAYDTIQLQVLHYTVGVLNY